MTRQKVQSMHMGYMCDKNIAAMIYYHGGTLVTITANIDRMTRTAREMTEAQRDSYEALTENLASGWPTMDSSSSGSRRATPGRPSSGSPTV
jgi:hypothetical protein